MIQKPWNQSGAVISSEQELFQGGSCGKSSITSHRVFEVLCCDSMDIKHTLWLLSEIARNHQTEAKNCRRCLLQNSSTLHLEWAALVLVWNKCDHPVVAARVTWLKSGGWTLFTGELRESVIPILWNGGYNSYCNGITAEFTACGRDCTQCVAVLWWTLANSSFVLQASFQRSWLFCWVGQSGPILKNGFFPVTSNHLCRVLSFTGEGRRGSWSVAAETWLL